MTAPNPPETRWCTRCGETKPLDNEHFSRSLGHSAFAHHCRECGTKSKYRKVNPIQNGREWS